ncbi:MAG: hypothetical protein EHM70_16160 [Chloroflexota bacterium]|nr:MAG: hypothetical protein EHM70_16160 [Chloroflexota bacterium]
MENSHHYDIHLELKPAEQRLAVEGKLTFAAAASVQSVIFYLHSQLEVGDISGELVSGYGFQEMAAPGVFFPMARMLRVTFTRPLAPGEQTEIRFRYGGAITQWPTWSANVVSPGWIEMGLYLPWFPLLDKEFGSFTYDLSVDCDPAYQVRSSGAPAYDGKTWRFSWDRPTNDIVVIASPDLKTVTVEAPGCRVDVHYVSLQEATAHQIGEDLLWLLARFSEWYGGPPLPVVSLVQPGRASGGGYSRLGLVVMGGLVDQAYMEKRKQYARYLAHEAAHFWFSSAPTATWEDWLNESFSEYSALLALREKYGSDVFEEFMAIKREKALGAAPIWGFDRSGASPDLPMGEVEAILYHKGVVLLHTLSERVGPMKFMQVCREMVAQKTQTTAGFLALVASYADQCGAEWMEEALKAR